ncbi:MAG: ABC transporter ATP-binding protein [Conexivisphaerales archaeon]
MNNSKILIMSDITKSFSGKKALDHVNFDLEEGEIHALLGENGAGKTTLMNILFGLVSADEGKIVLKGQEVHITSPSEAIDHGIGMVHQHFSLIPTLNVLENFILVNVKGRKIDIRAQEIKEIANRLNLSINLDAKVSTLSAGERQRLEIIRMLYFGSDLMILDEPTSVLTPLETEGLFKELRELAKTKSIIFISHKLNEVKQISNRISVLRKGKMVGTIINDKNATIEALVKMMIEKMPSMVKKEPAEGDSVRPLLVVDSIKIYGKRNELAIDFKPPIKELVIGRNEIVGLAGVAGNGQRELFNGVAGLERIHGGSITFDGRDITKLSIAARIHLGIGYVPEDRLTVGLAPDLSVKDNLILKDIDKGEYKNRFSLNDAKLRRRAIELVKEFDIRTQSIDTPVKYLSGGNLQRVILAREISLQPKLLLAYEPTKGLDVGATTFIRNRLIEYSRIGSVLIFSEDLDELLDICDRIYIIYEGQLKGEVRRPDFDVYLIGKMMGGLVQNAN